LPSERAITRATTSGAGRAEQRRQQGGQLLPVEAGQLDPVDVAAELGPEGPQRAGQVGVAAVGREQQQPLPAQVANQEGQQVEGRAVDPVQVLDHQHHRGRLAQVAEQPQGQLEQPVLGGGAGRRHLRPGGAAAGQEPFQLGVGRPEQLPEGRRAEVALQAPEGLDDGAEGQAAADVDAAAGQDPHAGVVRQRAELADQPGLADAGLAPDEERLRPSLRGGPQGVLEPGQVAFPADEWRAVPAQDHDTQVWITPDDRDSLSARCEPVEASGAKATGPEI
jgi:hypothetical protein